MKPQSCRECASLDAPFRERQGAVWLALALVVLLTVAAYVNGIGGAFVFDDEPTIVSNHSIRSLSKVITIFSPPADATTRGRLLANATLAINYALSGLEPWSYHVFNILIHALSAAVLFGTIRRILLFPSLRPRFAGAGLEIALATAVLWAVHPLQTESVTYVVQRVESLAGLFYLLTLYCFVRSVDSRFSRGWQIASVAACYLGVASKEIIVSAPFMILLCDRTWVAGTFREALRRRAWLYVGLASTWGLLMGLILDAENRSGTAGFGTASSWYYLLTQCRAIVIYLKLVVWSAPLVFDYGNQLVSGLMLVLPQALMLSLLAVAVVASIWRRSSWGVIGFWFFANLAPSSSVLPVVTQTIAEHRMYLALAAVIVSLVVVLYKWFGRYAPNVLVAIGLAFLTMTVMRNFVYQTKVALWADTVMKRPENWRARNNLGLALAAVDRQPEALGQYEVALLLAPDSIEIRNNHANTLLALGRETEALLEIETVLRVAPSVAELHDTRGMALAALGRLSEARVCYHEALRLKSELPDAHSHLGIVFYREGKLQDALACQKRSLGLKPDYAEAYFNLGLVMLELGRASEARTNFIEALRWKPAWPQALTQVERLEVAPR